MGFVKTGYRDANVGTTSVKIAVDEKGQIAPGGTDAVGTRRFQINRVAAENNLEDNEAVLNFFLDMVGGVYSSDSNQMTVRWEV